MILLNFGRKLDAVNLDMVRQMGGIKIEEQIMLPIEAEEVDAFMVEVSKAFTKVKLTEEELSRDRVVVNPSRNQAAMQVFNAYLLGKCGKLPYVIVMHMPTFGLSARPELSAVLDLQQWVEGKN